MKPRIEAIRERRRRLEMLDNLRRNPPAFGPLMVMEPQASLRDQFAGLVMLADLITTGSDATPEATRALIEAAEEAGRDVEEHIAYTSYRMADAMLKARRA